MSPLLLPVNAKSTVLEPRSFLTLAKNESSGFSDFFPSNPVCFFINRLCAFDLLSRAISLRSCTLTCLSLPGSFPFMSRATCRSSRFNSSCQESSVPPACLWSAFCAIPDLFPRVVNPGVFPASFTAARSALICSLETCRSCSLVSLPLLLCIALSRARCWFF